MTSPDGDLLARVRERLAHTAAILTPDVMAAALRAECGGVLGDTDLLDGLAYLETELVGAGRLEPLLADPDVADVLVHVRPGAGSALQERGHRVDGELARVRVGQFVPGERGRDRSPGKGAG